MGVAFLDKGILHVDPLKYLISIQYNLTDLKTMKWTQDFQYTKSIYEEQAEKDIELTQLLADSNYLETSPLFTSTVKLYRADLNVERCISNQLAFKRSRNGRKWTDYFLRAAL